jgi:hypothetical protein
MKQITRANYVVSSGETIDVTVQATKVGEFVSASLDGSSLDAVSNAPLLYRFTITKASGTGQFLVVQCHFPSAAPDDACYQVLLQGSSGGGQFTGPDIYKSDDDWARSIQFTIS